MQSSNEPNRIARAFARVSPLPFPCALAAFLVATLVAGCAPERPESVPADARSVSKQTGSNPINFTAPEDGTVYVYNRSTKKMIYSGALKRGQAMELDPKADVLRIDGRTVQETGLRELNEYQVWFDAEPSTAGGTKTTVKIKE